MAKRYVTYDGGRSYQAEGGCCSGCLVILVAAVGFGLLVGFIKDIGDDWPFLLLGLGVVAAILGGLTLARDRVSAHYRHRDPTERDSIAAKLALTRSGETRSMSDLVGLLVGGGALGLVVLAALGAVFLAIIATVLHEI